MTKKKPYDHQSDISIIHNCHFPVCNNVCIN